MGNTFLTIGLHIFDDDDDGTISLVEKSDTTTLKRDQLCSLQPTHLFCLHSFISLRALITQGTTVLTVFYSSFLSFLKLHFFFCPSTPSAHSFVPWLLVDKTLQIFLDSCRGHVWFQSRTPLPGSSFRWNLAGFERTPSQEATKRTQEKITLQVSDWLKYTAQGCVSQTVSHNCCASFSTMIVLRYIIR